MTGKLITFEGIDGSGKSTIAKMISEILGENVVLTREPTDSWIGRSVIRAMKEDRDAVTIALLFMADRKEHLDEIKKWLDDGKIVLCDRFIDSTLAYQKEHLTIKNPKRWLSEVHKPFIFKPDLTFLFHIDPKIAMKRIKDRHLSIFEHLEFLKRVQNTYMELSKKEKLRFVLIDAIKTKAELVEECLKILKDKKII